MFKLTTKQRNVQFDAMFCYQDNKTQTAMLPNVLCSVWLVSQICYHWYQLVENNI